MKLTVKDRIVMAGLYPKESNIISQVMIRDIDQKARMTQEDIEKFGIMNDNGLIKWNGKAKDIEVEFSQAEIKFLQEQVERLDRENKINQDILDLCLKIKDDVKKEAK